VDRASDFHCVEGWSVLDVPWSGVRPADLLARAKPAPEATHAVFHSLGSTPHGPRGLDHYVECLPLERLLDPAYEYLLALELRGEPLPHDRGAPMRLVTPYDLAYKAIKFITRIELTSGPVDGWWTRANSTYPRHAPVPASRLRDQPGQ
jgi:DMSO/TMAO reductase YedYZ molybdopterin-dependent catalytic subunit